MNYDGFVLLSQHEEPDTSNLDVDYEYFEDFVWPILANRILGMEELKVCIVVWLHINFL